MSDITNHSLKEIIDNMKSKKISSYELTQKYIKNIEGAKKLNTFVTTTFEQALDKAKQFDKKPNFESHLILLFHFHSGALMGSFFLVSLL